MGSEVSPLQLLSAPLNGVGSGIGTNVSTQLVGSAPPARRNHLCTTLALMPWVSEPRRIAREFDVSPENPYRSQLEVGFASNSPSKGKEK